MTTLHSPWQTAVPRIEPSHRHWLTGVHSLTQKLKSHSSSFAVIRIHQKHAPLQLSEYSKLNLPLARRILQRQVLLICDQSPSVFAHTVTDATRVSRDWPFFNSLGNRALGNALFANSLISRISFEYTRLSAKDFLYQAAINALKQEKFDATLPPHLWARRSIFTHIRRPNSRMMVSEVLLPSVYQLQQNP